MKRTMLLTALVVAGGLTAAAFQQPPAGGTQERAVTVEKVKDNLYVLRGGGGNSAVFITANGVVVVDTKNPGWGQPLLDKIKTITDKPITTIINTHTHGDHVSGNVEFPATVDVVTHVNTEANMKEMRPVTGLAPAAGAPLPGNIFKENNGKGLPKHTFKDKMTLGKGADQIDLYYFGRAHTGGDAYVVFPAHRIMHAGDTFPNKDLPIMDANNGGSGVDYAGTLTKASGVANVDTIINGHTPANTTMADLKEYADFVREFVTYVQAGKKSGKSVDDVVNGWSTPAKYAGYNPKPARLRSDVEVIFAETK
jgi:glyoxylase-like metal-dependent hydrolase (beta-lactamase superfamily II)